MKEDHLDMAAMYLDIALAKLAWASGASPADTRLDELRERCRKLLEDVREAARKEAAG